MAKAFLGKSVRSDWFFLDKDRFHGNGPSRLFFFWSKVSKFKICNQDSVKMWMLLFFTARLPEKAKKIEIFGEISPKTGIETNIQSERVLSHWRSVNSWCRNRLWCLKAVCKQQSHHTHLHGHIAWAFSCLINMTDSRKVPSKNLLKPNQFAAERVSHRFHNFTQQYKNSQNTIVVTEESSVNCKRERKSKTTVNLNPHLYKRSFSINSRPYQQIEDKMSEKKIIMSRKTNLCNGEKSFYFFYDEN